MSRLRRSEESGVAALEFVIVSSLVFGLLALSIPLVLALQERIRLERVAGHTARFATSAPDRPRAGSAQRRPTVEEVKKEARRAYSEIGPNHEAELDEVTVTGDPRTAHPGDSITIRITESVDLGPVGALLALMHLAPEENVEMTVTAVGRQE